MLTKGEHTYGEIIRRGFGNRITIGSYTSIAEGVVMDGGFGHRHDFVSTYPFNRLGIDGLESNIVRPRNIVIGSDVWIGEGALIFEGVTIGNGAVVGARSIVKKDIPPYEIWAGSPARFIKKRFSDKQIESLLRIQWWNWDYKKIVEDAHLLQSNNIDEFIEKHL